MSKAQPKSISGIKPALRLELGDVLFLLYILAFVRQCFWQIDNNTVAWILTAAVSVTAWGLFLSTRPFPPVRYDKSFWLLVGVPLIAAFTIRLAFPDRSFDVLSYHVLHGDRSLRGSLLGPSDFLHSVPFNPLPDIVTGISRYFLGFRLGTAINLLVLLWSAQLIDKLLRPVINHAWLRSASILLIVLSENLLFELSTYMVDLLPVPLLLQATLLTLNVDDADSRQNTFLHIALMLGVSAALKLTTLFIALPLLMVCGYKMFLSPHRLFIKELFKISILMLAAFLAPILPFTIYIYRITGNPLFPLVNTFFKSPYWPTHGEWDGRWGPIGLWQTLIWPVAIFFKPERLSELAVYSGRLSVAFIVAIFSLIVCWQNTRVRTLCFVLISSALLWSIGAVGYIRYGLYQEELAGIVLVTIVALLVSKSNWRKLSVYTIAGWALIAVLIVQSVVAVSYTLEKEWGGRPTIFDRTFDYVRESKFILRDRSIDPFLSVADRARVDKVRVWFETAPKTSAFEVLLNPHAPIIAVRQDEFFITRVGWREFVQRVGQMNGPGMYSLCLAEDLDEAKGALARRGLEVVEITPFEFPFFSTRTRIGMMLIEVRVPQDPGAREEFENAWKKGAFAPADYREEIVALDAPSTLKAGARTDIRFKVKNLGSETWPSVGTKDFRYQINMGNHWILNGVRTEDNRAVMKADLPPGAETEITFTVNVPQTPGDYTLEIDMVHEGVTWFKERGARPLTIPITVRP